MTEITEADCNVAEYIAGDRARDLDYQVVAYHRECAALAERAKIVAWLRELAEEQGFLSVEDIEKAMNNKWTGDGLAENERIEALQADKAKLREALAGLTTDEDDDPCWFDHHGNCQAHFITNPCEMAIARAALQETGQ